MTGDGYESGPFESDKFAPLLRSVIFRRPFSNAMRKYIWFQMFINVFIIKIEIVLIYSSRSESLQSAKTRLSISRGKENNVFSAKHDVYFSTLERVDIRKTKISR